MLAAAKPALNVFLSLALLLGTRTSTIVWGSGTHTQGEATMMKPINLSEIGLVLYRRNPACLFGALILLVQIKEQSAGTAGDMN